MSQITVTNILKGGVDRIDDRDKTDEFSEISDETDKFSVISDKTDKFSEISEEFEEKKLKHKKSWFCWQNCDFTDEIKIFADDRD